MLATFYSDVDFWRKIDEVNMNSRERVLAAINHRQPDQVPVDFGGIPMKECLPEFLQQVLSHATPIEVIRNVEEMMAVLGQGGGYLCAPCHSLPEDVPVENILAMYAANRIII